MSRLIMNKSRMMTNILDNPECKWMEKTLEVMQKYGIKESELIGTKEEIRNTIHVGIFVKFHQKMTLGRNDRSKLRFFLEGK